MDEATKPISALNPAGRDGDRARRLHGPALTETLMRPGPKRVASRRSESSPIRAAGTLTIATADDALLCWGSGASGMMLR